VRKFLLLSLLAASIFGSYLWAFAANSSKDSEKLPSRTSPTSGRQVDSGSLNQNAGGYQAPVGALPLRNLEVATTRVSFMDPSRSLVNNGVLLESRRTLPTTIWTPRRQGQFPLVIFIHGYNIGPMAYQRFCSALASSGYVVAAPSFPLEDPSQGHGLNRLDIPNEALDVSFVISTLERSASSFQLEPGKIAVVGHSDGADVALLDGYGNGTIDSRVQAIVADAPDPISAPTGHTKVPLLLIQGTADSVVPYSSSQSVFNQLEVPIYYLSLIGADHLPPIANETSWTNSLDKGVVDFLDATVAMRGDGISSLSTQMGKLPLTRLLVK